MAVLVRLAWRNIWRNWRRTAIALVAIVLGLVLLLFAEGLIQGADHAIYGNAVRLYGGNLQVHAAGFRGKARLLPLIPIPDPQAVLIAARSQRHVVSAAQRIQTGGLVATRRGSHPVSITAIEPEVEAPVSIIAEHVSYGRFLRTDDKDAIVIGRGLADLLAIDIGNRIQLIGRASDGGMRQHPMTVVGIFDLGMTEAERGMVFINLPDAQTLYKMRGQVSEIVLSLEQIGQEPAVQAALERQLSGYEIDTWQTLRPEYRETLDAKTAFSTFFSLVVVFIACIGVLNVLLMAVFERTREMGVLAALGLKSRQVMALFCLEGMFIGVLGAAIGWVVGALVVWLVARVGIDYSFAQGMGEITALMGERLRPHLGFGAAMTRAVTVALVATLAAVYPAWLAGHRQPAEVLHHV